MIKTKEDFNEMMLSLMDEVNNTNPEEKWNNKDLDFSDKAKEYIREMAEYSRGLKWYNKISEKQEWINRQKSYTETAMKTSATTVYFDLLQKIMDAPTLVHLELAPVFLLPIIDDMLRGER